MLYLCATLQFVRYYCQSTIFYLNMQAYLSGHERLPFQERVLPILFIRPMMQSHWIASHLVHPTGIYTAERGPFYLLSLISLIVAGVFVQKLYNRLSTTHTLSFLVYPLFLFAVMWSYSIHNEVNFSYPYDFLGIAFFVAGLYCIYTRRFLAVFLLVAIGTFNRETTLFLIGIYLLDAATIDSAEPGSHPKKRFSFTRLPLMRVAALLFTWIVIKLALAHYFMHNDNSENGVRLLYNLGQLRPRLLPALLNICGYMLPIVILFRKKLYPIRFANYLYIFPVWVAVMFYTGMIVETRVYGELCSFTAIALVLIVERYVMEVSLAQVSEQNVLTPRQLSTLPGNSSQEAAEAFRHAA